MKRLHIRTGICIAALVLCLLLTMSCAVFAREVPDAGETGSITVTLSYEDAALTDGTLALYQVGNVAADDGDYSFVLSDAFADSGADLSDLEDADTAAALYAYAVSNGIEAVQTTSNTDGTVVFEDLEIGLYLVVQTVSCSGYEALSPFLVSVPAYEDGAYVYNVSAVGKFTLTAAEGTTEEETTEETAEGTTDTDTSSASTTLPQTGQLNWPVPVLAIGGLLLILAGRSLRSAGNGTGREKGSYAS